ncbi:MAG: c-type cytochrome biogenesis protein CcsB [Syntrophales bacterium]|nr:c-type cytochrome biogenesis protein CcsB [Syntrophales bacterium]
MQSAANTTVFAWAAVIYFLSALIYIAAAPGKRENRLKTAAYSAWAGFALHTFALALRWIESYRMGIGHAPLSNFYESIVFLAWAGVLFSLVMERRSVGVPGVFILPAASLVMFYASFSSGIERGIQPLAPVLRSNWLASHVISCLMGYASFAVACGLGVMLLAGERKIRAGGPSGKFMPDAARLDELIYCSLVVGFILLSIGIAAGSVWAHSAWGTYWSWDPKETWSLITWIVYAAALHLRLSRGWQGKRTAALAILGFISVLFTYLGVNFLPGLHSYLN